MQKKDKRLSARTVPARSGRGRPRAFDRDAALALAMRLFWIKGYEATSVADLTEVMGVGTTSLYAAFGSKDELYAEALQHYCAVYDDLVWGRFRSAATAREAALGHIPINGISESIGS
jgi:AcrR family transcriptional regulator